MVQNVPVYDKGPITYEAFAAVNAMQLVKFGTSGNAGKVTPAGAGDVCLGVATTGALPAGTDPNGTALGGYPTIDLAAPDQYTAVARRGAYKLLAAGTIAPGDFVKAGAAGTVVTWVRGTDTDYTLRVGQCIDPAGGTNGAYVLIDVKIG